MNLRMLCRDSPPPIHLSSHFLLHHSRLQGHQFPSTSLLQGNFVSYLTSIIDSPKLPHIIEDDNE